MNTIIIALVIVLLSTVSHASAQTFFETHQDNTSGAAQSKHVDPSTDLMLFPAPYAGWVRVPLYAAIQSDGPELLVTCHGILRRISPAGTGWTLDPDTIILWTIKLTPAAMVGGEYFVPVPLFPVPEGFEIIASFSYATGAHALRTRAVSVQVPAAPT